MLTNLFVFAEDIQKNREREAARSVIMRTVPSLAKAPEKLQLEIIEKEDGHDVFETKASGGILNIRGSSGTALCRGFYDFLKTNRLGMVSWDNKDIRWPAQLPDAAPRRIVSPFRNHYYFNVVSLWLYDALLDLGTLGKRNRLDGSARHRYASGPGCHGGNRRPGMETAGTDGERNRRNFSTGPAHLPWQRMGNIVEYMTAPCPPAGTKNKSPCSTASCTG